MAKRKKNAGQGYGMQFHGAFATKADAKKKERKVHGFIKPSNIKGERRFVVMSERKNPRKPRNREELLDQMYERQLKRDARLRARHERRARVRARIGRRNPEKLYAATDGSGVRKTDWGRDKDYPVRFAKTYGGKLLEMNADTGAERVVKSYRQSGKRYGTLENPSELVVLGANPAPHEAPQEIVLERGKSYLIRSNPSAEAIREEWTGAPADAYQVYDVEGIPRGDYAQLGELLALYVKPTIGGQVRELHFKRPRPLLVSDTSARQLYFVRGNQDPDISENLQVFNSAIPSGGRIELGEVRRIDYKQRKEHVPDPEIDEWKHNFGEETGVRPTLWFDPQLRQLFLEGGEYTVRREGLTN